MQLIRELTEADIASVDPILISAYQGGSRQSEMVRNLKIKPAEWLLLLKDDRLAGMVGAILYDHFAYIGLMAVHADFQRQGLGRLLMETIIHKVQEEYGVACLLDASPMGAPLYLQLGFKDLNLAHHFDLVHKPANLPGDPQVTPLSQNDLGELAAYDAPLFGANRQNLLEIFFKDLHGRAFIRRDPQGQITGYLFAQEKRIGPSAANSAQDMSALLSAALQLKYEIPPAIIIPAPNQDGINLVQSMGFELKRSLRHQQLGRLPKPRNLHHIFAQASFLLG
jgi:predicted N-acetyltransferase YhbS